MFVFVYQLKVKNIILICVGKGRGLVNMASSSKDFQVFLRLSSEDKGGDAKKEAEDHGQVACQLVPQEDGRSISFVSNPCGSTDHAGQMQEQGRSGQEELFEFDGVFRSHEDNSAVYKGAVRDIVENTLLGYHGTVISFGEGECDVLQNARPPKNNYGAILRSSEQIFSCIERSSQKTGLKLIVLCSFVAIAEEKSFDILAPIVAGKSGNRSPQELDLVNGRLHGLSQCEARSTSQVKKFLTVGRKFLKKMEADSLHTVFIFTVEHAKLGHSFAPVSGTLNLVDIAYKSPEKWEESGDHSSLQAFVTKILSITEASSSNVSSTGLSTFRKKLMQGSEDTPPDTPLMSLLSGSLGGNCKTTLLCHILENQASYKVVTEILGLASLARSITNHPDKRDLAQQALLSAYLRELGITKMVLDKAEGVRPLVGKDKPEKSLQKITSLSSPSGTKLRDIQDTDECIDGEDK